MADRRCETCEYWYRAHDALGECRRRPPVVILRIADDVPPRHDEGSAPAYWPATQSADWCGEWSSQAVSDMRTMSDAAPGKLPDLGT